MARVALWAFDEIPGSTTAVGSETGDGTAQNGTYQNGATTDGSGAGVFDGEDDYVEIPHDDGFALDSGSIAITFIQETASIGDKPWGDNSAQTLFSRDATGFGDGGHISIFIKPDGSIGVRHQDDSANYNFSGGSTTLGEESTIIYSWSPTGSQLIVDGVVVDTGSNALSLSGNSEPITIGASQGTSDEGVANDMTGFFDGEIKGVAIYDEPVAASTVPCFAYGTLIQTPNGEVPVEALRVGDLVTTQHNGAQPIRWMGSCLVALSTSSKLCPIRITAGAHGNSLPYISYFHLMFDQHEVIFAQGAPAESLYAGTEALKSVPKDALQEIQTLFPELSAQDVLPEPALPIPSGRLQKQLVARHLKNKRSLLEMHLEMP